MVVLTINNTSTLFAENWDSPRFLTQQPEDVIKSHELAGDIFQGVTNVIALSIIGHYRDKQGFIQYLETIGTTFSTTYLLKYTTRRQRPNGGDYLSFPSGHTSMTFAPAQFVNNRYGFLPAMVIYGLAAFTGISRIEARKHYVTDVLGGAAIGIGFAYLFTTKFEKKEAISNKPVVWLSPQFQDNGVTLWNWGINMKY